MCVCVCVTVAVVTVSGENPSGQLRPRRSAPPAGVRASLPRRDGKQAAKGATTHRNSLHFTLLGRRPPA